MTGKRKLSIEYICDNCGSDKTYMKSDGREVWAIHDDRVYCNKCDCQVRKNTPGFQASVIRASQNKIRFYNERVKTPDNPRTGICSKCGAVKGIDCKRTSIHHEQYDRNDPLSNTIELCNSCHAKITRKM